MLARVVYGAQYRWLAERTAIASSSRDFIHRRSAEAPREGQSAREPPLVGMSRIAGPGKLVVANYPKQGQEEWKVCLCHDVLSFLLV